MPCSEACALMVPRMGETKGSGRSKKMPWVRPLLDFGHARMTDGVVALRGSGTNRAVASFDNSR